MFQFEHEFGLRHRRSGNTAWDLCAQFDATSSRFDSYQRGIKYLHHSKAKKISTASFEANLSDSIRLTTLRDRNLYIPVWRPHLQSYYITPVSNKEENVHHRLERAQKSITQIPSTVTLHVDLRINRSQRHNVWR